MTTHPTSATSVGWPTDADLMAALEPWLLTRRWFPLKGEAAPAPGTVSVLARWDMADGVRDHILAVPRTGGGEAGPPVLLHVPLVLDDAAALARYTVEGEAPGAVGVALGSGRAGQESKADADSSLALVDGPHHPAFWRAWAEAALEAGTVLGSQGAWAIAARAEHLRVTTGEQSNTSVVLPAPEGADEAVAGPGAADGDQAVGDLIVKVFRVLAPGRNPDVEVSVALARDGWDRVRRPVAWSTLSWEQPGPAGSTTPVTADGGVACTFVPRADDGFELFSELAGADDAVDGTGEVRRRATDLARRLGATTAQMHAHLARALGTSAPAEPGELATALRERARWAQAEVPELARTLPGLAAGVDRVLDEVAALEALPVASRVHGDYHLGQVLHARESGVWYVLDFEGEPLRPLSERAEPDQPLRDVAGMLRSFDYAAAVGRAADPHWLPTIREAFLEGYHREQEDAEASAPPAHAQVAGHEGRAGTDTVPLTGPGGDAGTGLADAGPGEAAGSRAEQVLLTALELDKALYEAVYEARNRPDWLSIPLHGVEVALASS